MIDINAIVNAVIATAVSEATQPLVEHIARLQERLAALENNPAIGIDTALAERVAKLETKLTEADLFTKVTEVHIDEAKMVEALNTQEWFWEKLSRKAKEIADAAAEEAIEDHCQNYDHDDYDRVSSAVDDLDLDELVRSDDLQDTVRDLLNDASIDVRFSF